MKANRSTGIDKISVRLLQEAGTTILNFQPYIINLSIKTGIFPEDCKIARVTPIYKSDDLAECANYRPISVISKVANTYQKLIFNRLISFVSA